MPTPVTLYRNGNTTSPRLDNVRDNDAERYQQDGAIWVRGNQRGISTFDATAPHVRGSRWWTLPAGTAVLAGLNVVNDNDPPGHWAWQPGHDMPLSQFENLLRLQGATADDGGQWTGPSANNWPGPGGALAQQEIAQLTARAAQAATRQVPLSAKAHSFVLDALDGQIATMRDQLARVGDDEDAASDLTNDLVLLQLIHSHLGTQGPIRA